MRCSFCSWIGSRRIRGIRSRDSRLCGKVLWIPAWSSLGRIGTVFVLGGPRSTRRRIGILGTQGALGAALGLEFFLGYRNLDLDLNCWAKVGF
jgi:hypothetical protein